MAAPKASDINLPAQQATKPQPVVILRSMLEKSSGQIKLAIPRGVMSPDRLARCVMTEFQKNDFLWTCSPESIIACTIQSAQLGLEIGAALGQAYMVPFYNNKNKQQEAQFIVGYRGLIALAHRSGMVKLFAAHVVYENDYFEYQLGSDPKIVHKPHMGDRGKEIGCYAVLQLNNGGHDFEFMSWTEILQHGARYSKTYAKDYSPWKTNTPEMAKKTLIRRLSKRCPMSIELADAIDIDEQAEITMHAPPVEAVKNRLAEALNGSQPKMAEGEVGESEPGASDVAMDDAGEVPPVGGHKM